MSLAVHRPAEAERASVLLPTVTCSSCAAPIPINSLGEHICQPLPAAAPRATGSRATPRPSQLTIPATRPSPTSPLAQTSTSSRSSSSRAFAGPTSVSSGSRPSPSALEIPIRNSPAKIPSPLSSGGGPQFLAQPTSSQPRTPSPTNPFFPHPDQGNGVVVHGLGLGVGASSRGGESPYPTDRQLPAGINGPGLSDGAAGMAGVGRRAFAAAAWGVRAGVAMAQGAAGRSSPVDQDHPPIPSPHPHPPHSGHSSSPHPPYQQPPSQPPVDRRTPSPPQTVTPMPVPAPKAHSQPREHIPPSAPLANRPAPARKASSSNVHIPERSTSAMSHRSTTTDHRRKESVSSTGSQRSGNGDSISQLIKARAAGEPPAEQKKPAFFEKYKQFVSDGRHSPSMGLKPGPMTSSPENIALRIEEEEDEEESALPWATKEDKPVVPLVNTASRSHSRQPTLDSSSSHSSSSSRSGINGGASSGTESEEVVTPSQSWEGSLVDRVTAGIGARKPHDLDHRDVLEQIGEEDEEDEGDRVVFGFQPPPTAKPAPAHSQTVKTRPTLPDPSIREASHARSHTVPELGSSAKSLSKTSRGNTSKRTKQCQKCLEIVGGSKRFVERDGVVLCEKDWKKLYLPSCRRCHLPIEKSAVSSSDGQLKGKWHKACFSCTKCSKPFEGDSFYVLGGKPWCQYHYHEENGTLCASTSCRQPIEGPCLVTGDQRYHPGHLHCDKPGCKERMDEYYQVESRRYCATHIRSALSGLGSGMAKAEKRHTRLVDLPAGGAFGL